MRAMKARILIALGSLLMLCSCGGPAGNSNAPQTIGEDKLRAALQTAFGENDTLKMSKSFLGELDAVGPVFIDGANARSPFKLRGVTGLLHDGEAKMSRSQDGRWYLVHVSVPIKGGSSDCNYPIE